MDPAVQARVDANPDAMRMQRDAAVARPPPGGMPARPDPAAMQAKMQQARDASRAAGAPPPGAGGYGTPMPQLGRPPAPPPGPRMPPPAGAKPMSPGGAFGMRPQAATAGPWGQQSKSAMMTGRSPDFNAGMSGMKRGGNQ